MKIQENFTIYIFLKISKISTKSKIRKYLNYRNFQFKTFHFKFSSEKLIFFEKSDFEILKDSGIPREEIFVNSKIYNTCYNPNLVPLQLEKSLEGNFYKVGCVLLMVVVNGLSHLEIGRNELREDAPHFI